MSKPSNPLKVVTPEFRVSFPQVFKAKAVNETSEPKYGIVMLFKKGEDLSKLKAAAKQAVKDKWGDDAPKELRSPFKNQGDREYDGYVDGALCVSASSKSKPAVVDGNLDPIIDESEFYPGCYAIASLVASAYGGKGTTFTPGVNFYLQNVQKQRDGDSLSGRSKPEDDFKPIEGAEPSAEAGSDDGLFD